MFAQMMKFQMESQPKKWGKTPSTSERKRRKNLKKKRGKTIMVLPWIEKQQEALF